MKFLTVTYANPNDHSDEYELVYQIRNHSVAKTWAKLVDICSKKYPIDDPGRFVGFGDRDTQISLALSKINSSIDTINSHRPIIEKRLTNINDQDTLNYLHHIFEVYHGLLDTQDTDFWNNAPANVHQALGDLNTQVHECELIGRSSDLHPGHNVTWYSLPKKIKLTDDEYDLFELGYNYGSVYLSYAEIGKPLLDLSIDRDNYISDEAFRPFRHISSDFFVAFYTDKREDINVKLVNLKKYYDQHHLFFEEQGLPWGHAHLKPGYIPVADLINAPSNLIEILETRQWVKSVKIS